MERLKKLFYLFLILILLTAFSLFVGRYPSPGVMNPKLLQTDALALKLVMNLRLPRILTSLLLGSVLAGSGLVFQMIFSNPLVEPGFLGVSQGAAFGAAFSIIFFGSSLILIQGSAAFFALSGLALSYFIARRIRYGGWILRLILSGIAISALFSAGLGLMKFAADPMSQLPEITFWLLGGLWSVTWRDFFVILPVSLISLIITFLMRWKLNILNLDDETAYSLGVAPERDRIIFLFTATAATAAVISVSGIVNWVGLIVPHIARRYFRTDTRFSIPAAMMMGALFTLICDTIARTFFSGEIPLGILTSLIGAVLFLVLLTGKQTGVNR
ncbi:FecCD family ABC transporter permease [Spirochaeta isovalerica]|uniref:Iron complex transport system permease protein n=1 Tax=Spirochaeta isovalerica TaxID=150 RepID=A0A841RCU8_9SPIO|nr:iron ABC transporter permease [Spirochaeta isovalerica]MBB6481486.1 iron complex transport system permease protein [Spirochaeta isovalerica]